jgi:butyrate kinase
MIDPVVFGELIPGDEKYEYTPTAMKSRARSLSIKEAARRAAEAIGRPLGEISLIVVHIGEEVTVGSLKRGSMSDMDRVSGLKERGRKSSINSGHRLDGIEECSTRTGKGAGKGFDLWINRVVKKIGALYAASGTDIEAIVLSGELVTQALIRDSLRHRVSPLAPVIVFEGSLEMEALASAAVRVLSGEEKPKWYNNRL